MIIFLFFLFFKLVLQSEVEELKYINLPIYKDEIIISTSSSETMKNLIFNKIYINSKIGSNKKNIKLYLRFNEYITYITNNYYIKEESNTYEFTRKKEGNDIQYTPNEFHTDDLNSGYESKDELNLGDYLLKNFNFILVDKLNKDKEFYYPIIGLNLIKDKNIRPVLYKTNFLEQLKNNNFIQYKIFSILFFNNEDKTDTQKGEILLGKLPHEYKEKNKFKNFFFDEKNLFWLNTEIGDYNLKWKLKFDNIKYVEQEVLEKTDLVTELIIEQNFFTGTLEFKNIIHKNFFEELISKNICREDKFYNNRENLNYFFYSCNSELNAELSKEKNNKEILEFNSNSLNEVFSFKLSELFFELNNIFYFTIIFDEYQMHGWKLGKIFFEKYPLVFSLDNNAIGYYNQNLEKIKNNSNNKITYILIVMVLILLIIIFIGIWKYNILKKLLPRKLMANELLDEYSYNSNIDNNNDKNNEITMEMSYKNKTTENKDINKLGV